MRKIGLSLVVLIVITMATSFFTLATSTYFDEFDLVDGSEYIIYSNLSQKSANFGEEIGWADAPDSTVLTADFSGGSPSVTYHISGVDRLTVSFYTPMAPLACKNETGDYTLISAPEYPDGSFDLEKTFPVLYSPVDGNFYLNTSDQGYLLCMVENGQIIFHPLPDEDAFLSQIKDSLSNSFLQVLVSEDGESYHPIDYDFTICQASITSASPLTYYYCSITLPIPSGTRYISLLLNYLDEIPMAEGGVLSNPNRNFMRLARTEFVGEYLNWGDPLPDQEDDPDSIFEDGNVYIVHRNSSSSTASSGDKITQYFEITNNYYNGSSTESQTNNSPTTSSNPEESFKLILSDEVSLPAADGKLEQKTTNVLVIVCSIIYLVLAASAIVILIFKYRDVIR